MRARRAGCSAATPGRAGSRWACPRRGRTRGRQVEVSATGRAVLYASGAGGLYKSTDDGASWTLLLPTERHVQRIAASPADSALVYLALVGAPANSGDFWFLRSQDGGASWQQLEEHHNSLCGWGVPILLPHPTAPGRVFRAANCLAGRNFGDALWHSADRGETWSGYSARHRSTRPTPSSRIRPARRRPWIGADAVLPRGQPRRPLRRVHPLAQRRRRTDLAWRCWRSAGAGRMDRPEAPSLTARRPGVRPGPAGAGLRRVNVPPGRRNGADAVGQPREGERDGGGTWADLGGPELGEIERPGAGRRRPRLYLATDRGLWRLRLDGIPAAAARAGAEPV